MGLVAPLLSRPIQRTPEDLSAPRVIAVDHTRRPFAVKSAAVDPHNGGMHRYTAIEQNVKVDESQFAMPAAKK